MKNHRNQEEIFNDIYERVFCNVIFTTQNQLTRRKTNKHKSEKHGHP